MFNWNQLLGRNVSHKSALLLKMLKTSNSNNNLLMKLYKISIDHS